MFGSTRVTPEVLLGIGQLARGNTPAEQVSNAGMGVLSAVTAQKDKAKTDEIKNKTVQLLSTEAPELAAAVSSGVMSATDAYKMHLERKSAAEKSNRPDYMSVDGLIFDKTSKEWITPPDGLRSAKLTDDQREYEMAKQQGFTGSFMDYQVKMKEAGRQQVNIDTGEKLPTGYRWKDTNNRDLGVDPIPGGPATQIPAELAARIGMAETFKSRLPEIKQKVLAGDTTGPLDVFRGKTMGTNPVYADIQSGVDALQRLLTGAGMNIAEAEQYAKRYMPGYFDDPQTTIQKIDRLNEELEAASKKAMLGRGGDQPADQPVDPLGIR